MAELTNLESKLGEVMGLAMAAQAATEKVSRLASDEATELVGTLEQMHGEAAETERRCMAIVETLEGKKTRSRTRRPRPSAKAPRSISRSPVTRRRSTR